MEAEEVLAAGCGVGVGDHVMTYGAHQVWVWGMQELTMVIFTIIGGHVEVTGLWSSSVLYMSGVV